MTLRDRMKALADKVRALPSKPSWDERPTTVTIRKITYAGGRRRADGPTTVEDLVLTPTPKVREVSGREIAASGGRYILFDVKVGPITPAYPGGGYTEAQLAPTNIENGVEYVYLLGGGETGEYARVDIDTDRSHAYFLTLRRRRTTP